MAKVIVVPDCHGQDHWKIVKRAIYEADFVVFLGDYWDHWTTGFNRQMINFKEIIKFKLKYKKKVKLLWGNHDISYFLNEQASGFQIYDAYEIMEMLNSVQSLLDVIFIQDNWIFAHGGVSNEWLKVCGIDNDLTKINQLFKERPGFFCFVGPDNYGDNLNEGPLWIRPDSLKKTAIENYNQCIGHTPTEGKIIPLLIDHDNNGKLLLIDSPQHNCIIKLDTLKGNYIRISNE